MLEALGVALAGLAGYLLKGWYERSDLEFDAKLVVEEGERWTQYFARVRNTGRSSSISTYGLITAKELTGTDALCKEQIIWANEAGLTSEKLGISQERTDSEHEFYLLTQKSFTRVTDDLLCWSRYGAPLSIDIPRKGSAKLVLFRHLRPEQGVHKPHQIQIPSEKGWDPMRVAFTADKTRTFKVRAVNDAGRNAVAKVSIVPSESAENGIEVRFATDC